MLEVSLVELAFWKNYELLLGILNFIVLCFTLRYLVIYTGSTQSLEKETKMTRIMGYAVDFEPFTMYYKKLNSDRGICFNLVALCEGVSQIKLISLNDTFLGETRMFKAGINPYYLNKSEMKLLLDTLKKNQGEVEVEVLSTAGYKFRYTFKTNTNNYSDASETNLHCTDNFILVKKVLIE